MTVMTRLNALDARVMPVVVGPIRSWTRRHPVAARRAPLVWFAFMVVAAVVALLERDTSGALALILVTGAVASTRSTKTRQVGSDQSR